MIFTSSHHSHSCAPLVWNKEFLGQQQADLLINTKNYIISNSTFLSRFSNSLQLVSFQRLKSFSSSLALPINISLSKSKSDLLTFSQLSHHLPRMILYDENPFNPHRLLLFSSSPGECWDYDDNDDDESIILSTNSLCVKFKYFSKREKNLFVPVVCALLLINLFIIVMCSMSSMHCLKISWSIRIKGRKKYDTRLNLIIIKWEKKHDWVFSRKSWGDKRWMKMRSAQFVIDKLRRGWVVVVIVKGWAICAN